VVRATDTYYDGTYEPYFALSELGNPFFYDSSDPTSVAAAAANGTTVNGSNDFRVLNQEEFPTSYDQRHSVSVLVNKRIDNLIETTVILDAGSGYPISSSATNDATLTGSVDGQHAAIGSSLGGITNFGEVPIFNPANTLLVPVNPVVGYTGWHFKFALNTTLHVSQRFSLFVNADNVFDRLTTTVLSTGTVAGAPYYTKPTAQYPEGREFFGPAATLTPIFLSFGFKEKF
jgi:hypothetical protein